MIETINPETGEITSGRPIRNGNPWTRVRVAKHFTGPSLAKQSFASECDINNIMRKYQKTGLIEHLNTHQGDYGNFIGFEDYHQSLNQILEAQESFASIPSSVRRQFNNDPEVFLKFAQNPENLDQMIEMGLAPPRPSEARTTEPPAAGAPSPGTQPEAPGASPEAGPPAPAAEPTT